MPAHESDLASTIQIAIGGEVSAVEDPMTGSITITRMTYDRFNGQRMYQRQSLPLDFERTGDSVDAIDYVTEEFRRHDPVEQEIERRVRERTRGLVGARERELERDRDHDQLADLYAPRWTLPPAAREVLEPPKVKKPPEARPVVSPTTIYDHLRAAD